MNPSAYGTGGIVIGKANSATNPVQGRSTNPPDYSDGGFSTQGGLGSIEPYGRSLLLRWALPASSPADFPIQLMYYSNGDVGTATEVGSSWFASYQRFAEVLTSGSPPTPTSAQVFAPPNAQDFTPVGSGPSYVTSPPGNNTFSGTLTTGWTETQADGTAFVYDGSGVLRSIRNNAGVRWTLTWDSIFNFVQHIDGPFGRRTTLAYDTNNNLRHIQDPGGRITTLVVDPATSFLSRIVTPELCTTSFIYGTGVLGPLPSLVAWIDPLGNRTSYIYDSPGSSSVKAMIEPLGQRTTYLSYATPYFTNNSTVVVKPLGGRTTIMLNAALVPVGMLDPAGNRTTYVRDTVNRVTRVTDALGNSTTFTYGTTNQYSFALTGVSVPGPGGTAATYQYVYDSNDNLSAVIDELGNRSTFVWDGSNNRIAVVDPYGQRTSYIYDAYGRPVAVVDSLGNRTSQVWDAQGRQSADIDALGHRTTYTYNINSQVASMRDPLGHISTYVWDELNRLLAQADPLGHRTSYVYDLNSRLIRVTDPLGHITTSIYNANGWTIANVDPLGHRTSYAYDADGNHIRTQNPIGAIATSIYDVADRLVASIDPEGNRTSYAYDAVWNPKRVTNALGNISTVVFNANDLPLATIDPLGHRTSFTYDVAMDRIRVQNALGNISTAVYDKLQRGVASVDPLGNRTSLVFDIAGRLIRATNPLGNSYTTVYDNASRVVATVDPLLNRATFAYDLASRQIRVTNPLGNSITAVYDAAGRPVATIDPLGARISFIYDAVSRRVRTTDALGHSNTMVYDAANRTIAFVDPLLNRASFTYDAANRGIATIDPLGHATTVAYDLDNRVVRRTEPTGGGITSFAYDALSRTTRLIDPVGNITSYNYDADNRVTIETDPLGHRTTYAFDAVGNLTQKTDRDSRVIQYKYDADQRVTRESWIPTGGGAATYISTLTYDAVSRVIGIVDSNSQYGYGYDNANRLAMLNNRGTSGLPVVTLTFGYDKAGNQTSLSDSLGGVNSYIYDARNAMTQISQSGLGVASKLATMTYDILGRTTGLTRYANLAATSPVAATSYIYDSANRLTRLTTLAPGGTTIISSFGYTLDAASRLTSELRTWASGASTDTVSYGYTNNNQVTSVLHTNGSFANESFGYDSNGNRDTSGYTTGPANQTTSDGTYNYAYDNEGNLISKTSIASGNQALYKWDNRNRLSEVDSKISTITVGLATYTYDAWNNLQTVVEGGATRSTVYIGQTPLVDFDGSNALIARYLSLPYEINQMVARETMSGVVGWYISDRLGTVRDLINNSGTVVDHIDYSVFGNVSGESSLSSGDRFKFAGMELDSVSGYSYVRARWYDAATGKFVSRDPIGFSGLDVNEYRYVTNNSLGFSDPSGLKKKAPRVPIKKGPQTWNPKNPNSFNPTSPLSFDGPTLPGNGYYPTGRQCADPKLFPAISAFNDKLRGLSDRDKKERGYAVFKNKHIPNRYIIVPTEPGGDFFINLNGAANSPVCPLRDWELVVCGHTHPDTGIPDPAESPLDPDNSNRPIGKGTTPIPWLVIAPDGTIFLIGPDKRGGSNNPASRNLGNPALTTTGGCGS